MSDQDRVSGRKPAGANIYLVGMMGAGKTTIGKRLAQHLGRPFIDLDQEIEARTGVAVATIFEIEGETGFRARESAVLQAVTVRDQLVVATGGGAVLDPMNRARLSASGWVVYLWAPAELLYARTRHDKNRPLLQVADPLARIRRLLVWRDPLYREIADLVVASGEGVANTVNCIVKALSPA